MRVGTRGDSATWSLGGTLGWWVKDPQEAAGPFDVVRRVSFIFPTRSNPPTLRRRFVDAFGEQLSTRFGIQPLDTQLRQPQCGKIDVPHYPPSVAYPLSLGGQEGGADRFRTSVR